MTIHYHARNRCFSIIEAVVRFQATVSLVPSNIEDPLPRPPVTTPRGLPPPAPPLVAPMFHPYNAFGSYPRPGESCP